MIVQAIINLAPGATWSYDEYEGISWGDDNIPQPTEAEIDAEVTRLQAEYEAQEYARNRKVEYDKLNQDELRYDDTVNGTTTWTDAIEVIKAKYPKPV